MQNQQISEELAIFENLLQIFPQIWAETRDVTSSRHGTNSAKAHVHEYNNHRE